MKVADKWTEYRLIDTSNGERLEDWNGVTLIRPDSQIIWKTPHKTDMWKKADGYFQRSSFGGEKWTFRRNIDEVWQISYGNLTFNLKSTGFKNIGLSPEQAVNWDFMSDKIQAADRQINVLNLFAYTGGATLACAAAGASVCHVDTSKSIVSWARENAELSNLSDRPIRWIVDDCEKFVTREIKRDRRYDAIIMEPPLYSKKSNGEVWRLEDNIYDFIELCSKVLSEQPLFFMVNSSATGILPSSMGYILGEIMIKRFGGTVIYDEIGLPVETGEMCLPCGLTAIWQA
ncbi:MAG: SAM-dependent methyltransferase [Clostridiales bacterium]|nr:SAM-dependent methyltransferase [Clostridiales bacterium]